MHDINLLAALTQTPPEIAADMWQTRFDIRVGMVSIVSREFTIELHRIADTEFLFILSNVTPQDKYAILDRVYGRS